ncbi:hypothetical protein JK364_23905 [Streptomyces sp. 110]|uniref:DNA-binding protein n=1 Tax=Streptomyces endocoffeicus TaxID=2898945 RepID=A0ABS1PTQ2_9ACTN|nr:hypothetical protein [Streptomyces endocoffeicus]MBL1115419.1 hypothetical protein [Streptomyces endocoffeicus]
MHEPATWLRPEYQSREDELIHLSAAADMVGVTRSAVSNWAARHGNFPKIVLLTGAPRRRTKWVVRAEFVAFARQQLNKKPGSPAGNSKPRRSRTVIETERAAHWEAQIKRLTGLEAKQAAALKRTREALRRAERNLEAARAGLAAEIQAVQQITNP